MRFPDSGGKIVQESRIGESAQTFEEVRRDDTQQNLLD